VLEAYVLKPPAHNEQMGQLTRWERVVPLAKNGEVSKYLQKVNVIYHVSPARQ
jgi:hypothetical protein